MNADGGSAVSWGTLGATDDQRFMRLITSCVTALVLLAAQGQLDQMLSDICLMQVGCNAEPQAINAA